MHRTTSNDTSVLDVVLSQRTGPLTSAQPDVHFELFACEQVVKSLDLSDDEVLDGQVGGGDDGGLDGIYLLLDGNVVLDDSPVLETGFDPTSIRRAARLELHVVQAKTSNGFEETAVQKVESTLEMILGLEHDEAELRRLFSPALVERALRFRGAYLALASRHPKVSVTFWYATKGDAAAVNPKVGERADHLRSGIPAKIFNGTAEVRLLGARELLELHSRQRPYTLELPFTANATDQDSHIALVPLSAYFAFLSDDSGDLRKYIFDWNIRDYEGSVQVNQEITKSLADSSSPEFWWLNNGVTIICSGATISGKTFNLDDVQVVNGLQTSVTLFEHFKGSGGGAASTRSLLVRIIVTDDLPTRDRVIRATNSQTAVPTASLRATDGIQRDLEVYLLKSGWYYDRRKNYYKNQGRPLDRIVTIPYVAQAMMAIGFSEPNNSRARPSSIIKDDKEYERLFDNAIPFDLYQFAVELQRQVDSYLRSAAAAADAQERTNFRFHLSMLIAARALGQRVYHPSQLRGVVGRSISDADMTAALGRLRTLVTDYRSRDGSEADKVAKSRELVKYILETEFPVTPVSAAAAPDPAAKAAAAPDPAAKAAAAPDPAAKAAAAPDPDRRK